MDEGTLLIGAFLFLVTLLVIFLIAREIVCWYWKLNQIVDLLDKNNRLLARLAGSAPSASPPANVALSGKGNPLGGFCSECERWVWVNKEGNCSQGGHSSKRLRDVRARPEGLPTEAG